MTFSRKIWLLISIVGLLAGCSATVDDEAGGNVTDSQIHLNSLTLESAQSEFNDSLSPLVATDKNFTIKACVVDSALLLSIPGKEFNIQSQNVTTDGSGCLRFNQKVALSYKGAKRYYSFKTQLKEVASGESVEISYAINPWDGSFVNLDTNPNFNTSNISALKSDKDEGFNIENLSVSFGGFVGKADGGARYSSVLSKVNATTLIPITGKALGGQLYRASVFDEESGDRFEKEVRSETNGQIFIPVTTRYEQHSPNRWIKKELALEAIGGPFDGQVKTSCYYINPWQVSGLYGWECRRGLPPEAPDQSQSKLYLDTMKFNYMGNDPDGFRINNYLELSMVKSYLIEVMPSIELGHDFMGDVANRRIMSGRFRLSLMVLWPRNGQLALTPENKDNFEFITGITKEVEVLNGLIRTQVDLNFNFYDLPKAATRTMAVVKLESLDDPENLAPAIVSGPFISTSRNFNSFLVTTEKAPTEQKLEGLGLYDPIVEKFEKILDVPFKRPPVSPWRNMSGEQIFDLVHKDARDGSNEIKEITATKQKVLLGLSKNDTQALLAGHPGIETLRKLCPLVKEQVNIPENLRGRRYYRPIAFDMREMDCMRNPEKLFKTRIFKNVKEITQQPKRVYSATDRMAVGVGFQVFKTDSSRVSDSFRRGYGGSLSAKISIPLVDWISIGGGANFDYSHTESVDSTQGNGHNANGNRTRFMYAEELTFGFKARTSTCALIEIQPSRIQKDNLERYKLCDENIIEEPMQESYYYIGEDTLRMSIIRDQFSYDENQLIKLIRGKTNFERFFNLLGDETKIIFLKKKDEIQSTNDYSRLVYRQSDADQEITLQDMAIPGVIELNL